MPGLGNGKIVPKGYFITDECISCGKCAQVCPQNAIATGSPSIIRQEHCLHCGNCFEHCPVSAIRRN
ncbi:4Fe-4S binding protein [Catenibacillus scindens]|uniref:4Fe-4S binding protein n=1 Tax=Catenibacillus scindens TaxID=673271 RepID=UPI00161C494F